MFHRIVKGSFSRAVQVSSVVDRQVSMRFDGALFSIETSCGAVLRRSIRSMRSLTHNNNSSSMKTKTKSSSLYVHWPFCKSICPYCDFNRYTVSPNADQTKMTKALLKELETTIARYYSQPSLEITSIYFGGGTPSLADPIVFESILKWVQKNCKVSSNIEITMEANPTSVEAAKLKDFKLAGVNRVSLGVQALNDDDLRYLGRNHSALDAQEAISLAQNTFENRVSFDLIYARHPRHTADDWRQEIRRALSIGTKHLSMYSLTFEQGTPFYRRKEKENMVIDEAVHAEMYDICVSETKKAGLKQYEISNYAMTGSESEHNCNYWNYGDYIGIGPGAASRVSSLGVNEDGESISRMTSLMRTKHPTSWMSEVESNGQGILEQSSLTPKEALMELLLVSLRTIFGLPISRVQQFYSPSISSFDQLFEKHELDMLVVEGFLVSDENRSNSWIRLVATEKGRRLLDSLLLRLWSSFERKQVKKGSVSS